MSLQLSLRSSDGALLPVELYCSSSPLMLDEATGNYVSGYLLGLRLLERTMEADEAMPTLSSGAVAGVSLRSRKTTRHRSRIPRLYTCHALNLHHAAVQPPFPMVSPHRLFAAN